MKLSAVCHEQLQEAEGRVEILLKKPGPTPERRPEPFEPEENPPL
jgi:exonuclease VII small subunit